LSRHRSVKTQTLPSIWDEKRPRHLTAPHTFEPTIELRSKIDNYTAIGISSGDVGLKEFRA
jgi:hypothetical protein